MPRTPATKASGMDGSAFTAITLQDLLDAVEGRRQTLSVTRRRDLRSAVKRVAILLGNEPVAHGERALLIKAQLLRWGDVCIHAHLTRQPLSARQLRSSSAAGSRP